VIGHFKCQSMVRIICYGDCDFVQVAIKTPLFDLAIPNELESG